MAARGGGYRRSIGPASLCIATLMVVSVALRTGVLGIGDYSDIVHIYRFHGLVDHPVPYFDYALGYPVITGAFVWAAGFVRWSAGLYFVASSAALGVLAVATVRMLERLPGTRPWLLAAAPCVAFWGVQNWDLLAIALLVAALALHEQDRDRAGAALLAFAVWAKFFPLVALPVVLAVRLAQGRLRAAWEIALVFTLVTLAVNLPVAIQRGDPGIQIRENWAHFYEYSHDRAPEATLWASAEVAVSTANRLSGLLLAAGIALLAALVVRCVRNGRDVLLPATGAALLWFLATTKVYSVQFSLWIVLAMSLAGLPLRAMIAFAAIDVLLFITLWDGLPWLGDPWPGTFLGGLRQVATAALAVWVAARMAYLTPARSVSRSLAT